MLPASVWPAASGKKCRNMTTGTLAVKILPLEKNAAWVADDAHSCEYFDHERR